MVYLNIVYFIIITALAYLYLKSDGKIIKGALCKEKQVLYTGAELCWLLMFSTGVFAFSLEVGLNLMALRLLVLEILCVAGIFISKRVPVWSLPMKVYVVYLLWMGVGVFYAPSYSIAIRVILKYSYPLLLCLFGSAVVEDAEVFMKSAIFARIVGAVTLCCSVIPLFHVIFPGVLWYPTARIIHCISLMVFSLGMVFYSENKTKNILYTLFFLAPCFILVLRTSILGSGVAIMAFSLIRYKSRSLPIIGAICILGIISIFTIPALRDKMFYDTTNVSLDAYRHGRIDENNVNTNYRTKMWTELNKKLYEGHEIIGSGTGAVQDEMYKNPKDYGMLKVPHSDWVQQKCDNGLIGFALYGLMIILVFADCFYTYWHTHWIPLKLCAITAGASLLGVYATFYSENTINYSMATLTLPFGFYAMMLGMRRRHKNEMF